VTEKEIRLVELLTEGVKSGKIRVGMSAAKHGAYSIHISWHIVLIVEPDYQHTVNSKDSAIVVRHVLADTYRIHAHGIVNTTCWKPSAEYDLLEALYKECTNTCKNSIGDVLDMLKVSLS
jgi:CTP:phosphocholine cytidylyltransferase-like protein